MKRGLYENAKVRRGSLLESALVLHETIEQERNMLSQLLNVAAAKLKEPEKASDSILDLYRPGHKEAKKKNQDGQIAYLRSMRGVKWSKLLEANFEDMSLFNPQ